MDFGNWKVTDSNIEWKGGGIHKFSMPLSELNATRQDSTDNTVFYDWILRATAEDWLTQNDLFDLNYGFVYGIAKAGLDFNFEIFDATLEEQFDQFDMEDNEDFEL
ncbi:hypothetical protein [Segetibacter aerophilus]|uniref:Uncharacterized protein n=1 Tax=Segetibacter aerophilus TaxID=670293 RepID=A0A512BAD2_9BACT|nr:hypothetical protein [Segetibacter aerophilus]GEO08915.1 hypothetical protein SAE01_14110 [Segetibacter aerophilus]